MHRIRLLLIGAALSGAMLATPAGAQQLTTAEINSTFANKTIYLEFAADNPATGGGTGIIYNAADGKISAKFPNGKTDKGTRVVKDNTSCITWEGRPEPACSRFAKKGDKIDVINVTNDKLRGTITKVVDGNPEKL